MATWPTTLPDPVLAGYTVAPQDQTIRTDMETGTARVRRRTTVKIDTISVAWVFTSTQMSSFRSFWEDSSTGLAGGSAWCTMRIDRGDGSTTAEARFSGPWRAERDGKGWRVSASLEVR